MLPLSEGAVREAATESSAESVKEETPAAEAAKGDEDSMASSAERMTILRMVEQGKISAEDGARLLSALGGGQEAESKPRSNVFDTSRLLQVRVSDLVTNRQKVNVNVPVGLFQLVWRWLPDTAQEEIEKVQLAIESGASGRIVEVVDQDSGVRVEITLVS
jgi:hypothetical protein